MIQHTTPCPECPFRRTSLAGYLGAHTVEEFSSLAMSETRMPCHSKVNYNRSDWRQKQETAPQCAGRAVLLGNQCKMPRDPELLRLPSDRQAVFSHIVEFKQHHERN